MAIKLFVVTKGERVETASRLIVAKIPFTVVTHREANLRRFQELTGFKGESILTGKSGVLASRNAILSLVKPDEWFMCMDDDMKDVTGVRSELFRKKRLDVYNGMNWRPTYRVPHSYEWLMNTAVPMLIRKCDEVGASLAGFASMENPYFRPNQWSYIKAVQTGCMVMRKGKLAKIKGGEYAHDQWLGAWMIANHGRNVINNFIHVNTRPFADSATGLGKIEDRLQLQSNLETIEKEFRGLVRWAKFPNLHYKLRSKETIDAWRKAHGYI